MNFLYRSASMLCAKFTTFLSLLRSAIPVAVGLVTMVPLHALAQEVKWNVGAHSHQEVIMAADNVAKQVRPSRSGIVTTKLDDGKLMLEIPRALLGCDLLIVGRITSGTTDPQFENVPGLGPNHGPIPWSPFANAIVRFTEEPGNMLRVRRHTAMAGVDKQLDEGGETLAEVAIIRRADDHGLFIDAQALLQQSKLGFHGKWATRPDAVRFTRASPLPDRVELNATTEGKEGPIGLQWSILSLPKDTMRLRLSDGRVNYSSNGRNIERWRLVKKDPTLLVSEPLDPIVVYMDSSVPTRFRKQVMEGIKEWKRAFESAGFKNALTIKQASPTDPDWSPFDLRHGVTVWWTGGLGGNCWKISDPRSGELISAVVTLFGDTMWDHRNEYFLHAGGSDTAAADFPVPDRILDSAVRTLTAHEMGHGVGLDHNFMSTFPAARLRDPKFTAREGSAPTVMGYNAFNRVAQPNDHVSVEAGLTPRVGAFDVFAIRWGYTDIPTAPTPLAEKTVLDQWAIDAQQTPWLRYTREEGTFGDIDPWEHLPKADAAWPAWAEEHLTRTRLYMGNLRRIHKRLTTWTDAGLVAGTNIPFSFSSQWTGSLKGVAEIVSSPVPGSLKREAFRLLNEEAFSVPAYLNEAAYVKRWDEQKILIMLLRDSESNFLYALLDEKHTLRLTAHAVESGYSLGDLVADLNEAFCRELQEPKVAVRSQRQIVQRIYVEELIALVAPPDPSRGQGLKLPGRASGEALKVFAAELSKVSKAVDSAIDRAADSETRTYLQGLSKYLANIQVSPTP